VEARFSVPVQTGPGAHPTSYTIGAGSFPGVKRPGRGVDHSPHLAPRLKERVKLYLYSLRAYVACSRLNFTFTFTLRSGDVSKNCNLKHTQSHSVVTDIR